MHHLRSYRVLRTRGTSATYKFSRLCRPRRYVYRQRHLAFSAVFEEATATDSEENAKLRPSGLPSPNGEPALPSPHRDCEKFVQSFSTKLQLQTAEIVQNFVRPSVQNVAYLDLFSYPRAPGPDATLGQANSSRGVRLSQSRAPTGGWPYDSMTFFYFFDSMNLFITSLSKIAEIIRCSTSHSSFSAVSKRNVARKGSSLSIFFKFPQLQYRIPGQL